MIVGHGSLSSAGTVALFGAGGSQGILSTYSVIKSVGSGTLVFDGGILQARKNEANFISGFTSGVGIADNGAYIDSNGYTIGIASAFFGQGSLVKLGTGTLTLSGSNSYGGQTVVRAGTLAVNGGVINSPSGTMAVGVESGDVATLAITSGRVTNAYATIGTPAGATGSVIVSGGTLGIAGALSIGTSGTGSLSVSGSGAVTNTFAYIGSGASGVGNATVSGGSWINSNDVYIGLGGRGTLLVSGGTIAANGNSIIGVSPGSSGLATISGAVWDTTGYLIVGHQSSGTLQVNSGLTLARTGLVIGNTNSGIGSVILSSGTLATAQVLEGAGAGTLKLNGGTLRALANRGDFLSGFEAGDVTIGNGGASFDSNGFGIGISTVLSGSGALTKQGLGTLTLTGSNTYAGGTVLNDGNLRVGNSDALGSGLVTIKGGTFGNAGDDVGLDNLFAVANNFLIDVQGINSVLDFFSNVDMGTGHTITFTGDGIACFEGGMSGDGITFLSGGDPAHVTFCNDVSNTFTGTLRLGTGVSLELWKQGDEGDPPVIAISGDLLIDQGATALLITKEQFSGSSNVVVNGLLKGEFAGTNTVQALSGTGTITSDGGDTLVIISGTFAGMITGDQAIGKAGAGVLALTGSNSYAGGTTVSSGTLAARHNSAVGTAEVIVEGGVFLVETGADVANDVVLSGGTYQRNLSGDLTGAVDARSVLGGVNTTAQILSGSSAPTSLLTSFAADSRALNDEIRLSDVYSFAGTGANLFVLQLSFTSTEPDAYLGWLSGTQWVNARDGNAGNDSLYASQFDGTFAEFQALHGSTLSSYVGAWGVAVDAGVTSAWTVLNHDSDFAVVPEPSAIMLAALGCTVLAFFRRRRVRAVCLPSLSR